MTGTGTVYVFQTWSSKPTYHDYGRIRDSADVTKCGLVMYDGETGTTHYNASLRRDHADLFAVPCSKCFAEAQA